MASRCRILSLILFFGVFLIPFLNLASAGIPSVSEIRVADVTTRSFSVIWLTSEPSTASLQVYDAPDCTLLTENISVVGGTNDNTGVIKVTVTGLTPSTTYCFQTETTSKSTSDVTVLPVAPQLITTESQVIRTYLQGASLFPFGNDLIYHPVYSYNQLPGSGNILMAYVDGGSYPLSAWVGDGMSVPDALIDFNNLYNVSLRESMNLLGDERVKLVEIRGTNGCTLEKWRKVPQDADLITVQSPGACFDPADLNCDNTVNILDVLRDVGGYNTASGGICFNSDLDMNGNGSVNILDILYVVGKYGTHR